jgi:hypothetical protein
LEECETHPTRVWERPEYKGIYKTGEGLANRKDAMKIKRSKRSKNARDEKKNGKKKEEDN